MDRLVVCSDSPWHTPQNLPDEYLRTLGNEPANLPSVVSAVAAARGLQGPEALALLKVSLFQNALRVFGLPSAAPPEVPAPEVVTAAPTDAAPAKDSDGVPPDDVPADGTAVATGADVVAEIERELGTATNDVDSQDNVQNEGSDDGESGDEENEATAEANELNLADLTVSAGAAPHYRCHKCRAFLFYKDDVLTHASAASRTIYKDGGGDALCDAVVFVRHIEPDDEEVESLDRDRKGGTTVTDDGSDDNDDRSDVDGPPMVILDKNVHCSNCSAKVGR